MYRLVLSAIALPALLLAACETSEAGPTSPTPVATPTATPTPAPTATATAAPETLTEPKVIFLRGLEETYPPYGVLWMSNLDSSDQQQLTPEDATAAFVAPVPDSQPGHLAFYYATLEGEDQHTLWKLDVATGIPTEMLSYASPYALGFSVSVSPDGRYLAYADAEGLEMFDTTTGETRRLFSRGDVDACTAGDLGECFGYAAADWSPDGSLLLVTRTFYEGASATVVDPLGEPPTEFIETNLGDGLPRSANWSPSGASICAWGRYAEYTGLYLASAPDWTYRNVLPEYEDPELNDKGRMLLDCEWLDETTVAFIDVQQIPSELGELLVLDTTTEEKSEIVVFEKEYRCCTGSLLVAPSENAAIAQFILPADDGRTFYWAQPLLVRLDSEGVQPILDDGDYVVTIVSPQGALPPSGGEPPTP